MYVGFPIIRKCMRAKYSPIIPSVTNCTPEKIAIVAAKKGKPGTESPVRSGRATTKISTASPNAAVANPKILAA